MTMAGGVSDSRAVRRPGRTATATPGQLPSPAWKRAGLTLEDRMSRGKTARKEAPRSSHGRWEPTANRPDPVALLQQQAESRFPSWSRSVTGGCWSHRLTGTFYRGAALIMASDLAATPHSGVSVQLCGDAHLSNFGVFGSPERQLIFDINDFDETLPGPWEWDVKRLAASFEIAAATWGSPWPTDARSCWPGSANTGNGCAKPRPCEPWIPGMRT